MSEYTYDIALIDILSDGLVALRWDSPTVSDRHALWSRCRLRKPTTCAVTGKALAVGDFAFRSIGNQDYRMRRIDAQVIEAVTEAEAIGEEPS